MQKPTLVLVPGLLCDETVWQPVVDRFGKDLPIVIGDCSTQDSITRMAKDTLDAAQGDLHVAGHSMGARVALEMVRLAPERIKKLALIDTGVHPRREGEEAKRQVMLDLADEKGMRALADQWLPPMVHPDRHDDTKLMGMLIAMVERMSPELHHRQITALLNRPAAMAGLEDITCPTTLIVGRQDVWSPVEQHEAMLPHLRNANLEIIEDAGHFAPVEQPEAFVATIGKWLGADA
jgi:pimeloyl-ACP methyl ester carboxylesterase